jgi:hypothetical protein
MMTMKRLEGKREGKHKRLDVRKERKRKSPYMTKAECPPVVASVRPMKMLWKMTPN